MTLEAQRFRTELQQIDALPTDQVCDPYVSNGRYPGIKLTAKRTAGAFAKAALRSKIPICIGPTEVTSISSGGNQSQTDKAPLAVLGLSCREYPVADRLCDYFGCRLEDLAQRLTTEKA